MNTASPHLHCSAPPAQGRANGGVGVMASGEWEVSAFSEQFSLNSHITRDCGYLTDTSKHQFMHNMKPHVAQKPSVVKSQAKDKPALRG